MYNVRTPSDAIAYKRVLLVLREERDQAMKLTAPIIFWGRRKKLTPILSSVEIRLVRE